MLAYLSYTPRYFLWMLSNLRRRLRRPPDYILFIVDDTYLELRPPRGSFWQRRLFPPKPSLQELSEQFRAVAGDSRTRGVVLHIRQLRMTPAHVQTLRDLIHDLRAAGKRVVVWSSNYDHAGYHVACAADEILLQTGGSVLPLGISRRFLFLVEALERLGVEANFIQVSPYKSAADILTRSSMSDEMRENVGWLMDSLHADFIRDIAEGRHLDEEGAKALVDHAPYTDLKAAEASVVDKLVSEEDLPAYLGSIAKPARLSPWEGAHKRLLRPPIATPGCYIALLRIEGVIVDGKSQPPPLNSLVPVPFLLDQRAGDLSVVQQVRQVLADKSAAAVVVYVNSPGGSATASEAVAAALEKVATKKHLVVSMGPVAGSGGYYISSPAHWIVAQSGTITGSIGVLSGKIVTTGLLDRLLLHRETISRGQHITLYHSERLFSEEERKVVWEFIKRIYDVFLERVSVARKMTVEEVDSVGGGRVWTGRQALERRLVDELGGLDKALAKARQLADLHPRAPIREVRASKQQLTPPIAEPAALVQYALEGLRMLNRPGGLCLCPLIWRGIQDNVLLSLE
jgi:protease-4